MNIIDCSPEVRFIINARYWRNYTCNNISHNICRNKRPPTTSNEIRLVFLVMVDNHYTEKKKTIATRLLAAIIRLTHIDKLMIKGFTRDRAYTLLDMVAFDEGEWSQLLIFLLYVMRESHFSSSVPPPPPIVIVHTQQKLWTMICTARWSEKLAIHPTIIKARWFDRIVCVTFKLLGNWFLSKNFLTAARRVRAVVVIRY